MKLNSKKELTPVVFGETSVKILHTRLAPDREGFEPHWHDRIELHLIKSGSLLLRCNDNEISVNSGELSIVSPTVLHSGKSGSEGYECYVIMFEIADLYNGTISAKQYIEPIIKGDVRFKYKTDIPEIVSLASNIVEMNLNRDRYHPFETVGCLYRLLGLLCQHCVDYTSPIQRHIEKFDSVISYVNTHFTKDVSASDISRLFGYDQSYFCRKFKKATGITLTKYVRTQRLEYARQLLERNEQSVRHIAVTCGFSDAAYFTNCFKAMYGISPLKYRARYISEQ